MGYNYIIITFKLNYFSFLINYKIILLQLRYLLYNIIFGNLNNIKNVFFIVLLNCNK